MTHRTGRDLKIRAAILDSTGDLTSKVDAVIERLPATCCEAIVYRDRESFIEAIKLRAPDLILSEFGLADPPGELNSVTEQNPRCVVILLRHCPTTSCKILAMQAGAHDVVDSLESADEIARDIAGHLETLRARSKAGCADAAAHRQAKDTGPLPSDGAAQTALPHPRPQSGIRRFEIVEPLWAQERRIIESTLAAFDGNIARAAAALQINPSTIYRKRQSWVSRTR